MSNKSKGQKYENEVAKILEETGWKVFKAQRTMRFIGKGRFISQSNDLFNLFDLVAKKPLPNGTIDTRWIQVKYDITGSNVSTAKPKIAEFAQKYTCEHEICEIWHKRPRKPWRILYYDEEWREG